MWLLVVMCFLNNAAPRHIKSNLCSQSNYRGEKIRRLKTTVNNSQVEENANYCSNSVRCHETTAEEEGTTR